MQQLPLLGKTLHALGGIFGLSYAAGHFRCRSLEPSPHICFLVVSACGTSLEFYCAFSPLANFGFAARIPSSLRAFAYCEIRKVGSILLTCLSVFEAPLLTMVCDSPIIFVFGSGYACISGCTVFSG